MLNTPHLLVGVAIGSQLPNAWQVVPLAAFSHFVLDSVPHIQGYIEVEDLNKKEVLDFLIDNVQAGDVVVVMAVGGFNAVAYDFFNMLKKSKKK